MNNKSLRIAIDGGAATGKSTVSKRVADILNIRYINTGQMYRLFSLLAKRENLVNNEQKLHDKLILLDFDYDENGMISSNDMKFSYEELNNKEISDISSLISSYPLVREIATKRQIEIGKKDNILLEGRDIGTIVMKDATHKFFITVSAEEAARRRTNEYKKNGMNVVYEDILSDIIKRNKRDQNREVAPLIPSEDSKIINTDGKNIEEVVKEILEVING